MTKTEIKANDFVICRGEGDSVFIVSMIISPHAYLLNSHGKKHGWIEMSKLQKIHDDNIYFDVEYKLKAGVWEKLFDKTHGRITKS